MAVFTGRAETCRRDVRMRRCRAARRRPARRVRSRIPARDAIAAAASPKAAHSFSANQTGSYRSGNGPRGPRSAYRDTSISVRALAETAKPARNDRRLAERISASAVSRASTASARNRIPSLIGAAASE